MHWNVAHIQTKTFESSIVFLQCPKVADKCLRDHRTTEVDQSH